MSGEILEFWGWLSKISKSAQAEALVALSNEGKYKASRGMDSQCKFHVSYIKCSLQEAANQ